MTIEFYFTIAWNIMLGGLTVIGVLLAVAVACAVEDFVLDRPVRLFHKLPRPWQLSADEDNMPWIFTALFASVGVVAGSVGWIAVIPFAVLVWLVLAARSAVRFGRKIRQLNQRLQEAQPSEDLNEPHEDPDDDEFITSKRPKPPRSRRMGY